MVLLALALALVPQLIHGYIPAHPSNVTNLSNASAIHLQWYAKGSDLEYLSPLSLLPATSVGSPTWQGMFVHFAENGAGNDTTTTPWIAFMSCDANSTNPLQDSDIFSLAKDRGAKAAILYSLSSQTCVTSPGYQSLDLDLFTTQSLDSSLRIEYEFGQFGPSSATYYGYFNATMLNDAAGLVNNTIAAKYPTAPGFLFATLLASNTSDGLRNNSGGTRASDSSGNNDSQNTGVAMIVLYAITGCVSALFCAVIVSGAIRAIRYPERYGPRAADPALGGGQSRARGLGRAILDTFPVVKFGSGNDQVSGPARPKDVESSPMGAESSDPLPVSNSVQLAPLSTLPEEHGEHPSSFEEGASIGQCAREDHPAFEGTTHVGPPPEISAVEHGALRPPPEIDPRMPECIGRETCPICIYDFEEGDDLRVLPCEGKHRFHQSCVDPWLLELSASCPICRQDFRALETIISGESDGEASSPTRVSATPNRFSRYLRFTRGRQRGSSSRDQPSSPSSPTRP